MVAVESNWQAITQKGLLSKGSSNVVFGLRSCFDRPRHHRCSGVCLRLQAVTRRDGGPYTNARGQHDFNADLCKPAFEAIAVAWEAFFSRDSLALLRCVWKPPCALLLPALSTRETVTMRPVTTLHKIAHLMACSFCLTKISESHDDQQGLAPCNLLCTRHSAHPCRAWESTVYSEVRSALKDITPALEEVGVAADRLHRILLQVRPWPMGEVCLHKCASSVQTVQGCLQMSQKPESDVSVPPKPFIIMWVVLLVHHYLAWGVACTLQHH